MLNLFVIGIEFSEVEKLEIVASKEGLCFYLLSELHKGTWSEEEGANLVFNALLPIKEPANLWASEVFDKAQLKGIVEDLNGMGYNISFSEEANPRMREYEDHAKKECAEYAQLG